MPLNSAEIAQSVGMYQQQYAQQLGYSGMIGGGAMPQVQAESMGAGILNRGMAIGGPVASLAMGMAGVDPLSMGMRAASFGASRLGLGALGAGAMGIGAATGVGAAMAVGGFAANQMYTGMQQQQQFNQSMRQSFNFLTPAGQGFTGSQLGQISQQLRGMADQSGPAGQMTSFSELTKLAANMGQMGMGQGVRDVQEFGKRFRQMVDTLKVVAKEMGTSLEAAQQFTSNLRGSGIFNQADQVKAAATMRAYSASGTIAVSEISAMGNIGSQISRSVGGRGRSGAMAGMKTMGMVGAAIDSGALSEEDIYNATGLTGAEGRQAYATAQLGSAANFLKTGKGRYFLASVAGENGKLDDRSVAEWMSGDVGVGRTKGMAGSNLGKVGRANFIRNEGRLRGSALEQFGGMLPAMALMSWAGERGIDINTMNDREMLFASRQLGIGMDQLEGTVNQVRNMPQMMKQLRMTKDADTYLRNQAEVRKTQGIEGAKRAFEHARDKVQNALQETGANFYTDLNNFIETSINKMSDTYVEQASKDIQSAYEKAKQGNVKQFAQMTGIGSGGMRKGAGLLGMRDQLGGMPAAGASADAFMSRGVGGFGTSDADRMAKAGYGSFFSGVSKERDPAKRDAMVAEGIRRAQAVADAAQTTTDTAGSAFGTQYAERIQDVYRKGGGAEKQGMDRIKYFEQMMKMKATSGDKNAQAEYDAFLKRDAAGKAAFVAAAEKQAGISEDARLGNMSAPGAVLSSVGGSHSLAERDKTTGEGVMGKNTSGVGFWAGAVAGASSLAMLGPIGMVVGGLAGAWAGSRLEGAARGTNGRSERAGAWMHSDKGQEVLANLMSANTEEQAKARAYIGSQLDTLQARKGRGDAGLEGEIQMFSRLSAIEEAARAAEKKGGALTEEEANRIAKSYSKTAGADFTGKDILTGAAGIQRSIEDQRGANRRAIGRMYGASSREKMKGYQAAGIMNEKGEISADLRKSLEKAGGKAGLEGVLAAFEQTRLESTYRGDGGKEDAAAMAEVNKLGGAVGRLQDLSVAEKREMAKRLREGGEFAISGQLSEFAGAQARNERTLSRGGQIGLARALGVQLNREDMRTLSGFRGEAGAGKAAAFLAQKLGVTGASAEETSRNAEAAGKELATAEARLEAARKAGSQNPVGAERDVAAARERLREAQSVAKEAALADPVRKRLEEITKLQASDPKKAAAELTKFQQTDEYQKLQAAKKEKEDSNSPQVRGLTQIKDALETQKGVLTQGFANVVTAVKKDGDGGDGKPLITISDERLKENIEPLPDPLALLEGLHGYQYTWKGRPEDGKDVGVLAQEVEKVLPEAVAEVDGVKRVYYHKLVPVLLEAVKALSARVAELEKKED